tara:strand:- start:663 stop:1007 length:345 start_codon:yes stop_codon:yes gene_type:complete
MAKKKSGGAVAMLGRWAFLIGVLLALLFGFVAAQSWTAWLLVLLGLVIGLLNIEAKEVNAFLMAGTVLALMGYLGGQSLGSVAYLGTIFNNLLLLFVPATIIVALKSVFALAKN